MNKSYQRQTEKIISYKEVLWDLLTQWKAVLIVAVVTMILVSGAKYYKDMKAYKLAEAKYKDVTQVNEVPQERIAEILSSLPENEVSTVEFLVKQNEWIESEKEYLNNSILMNTNPANQRTLLLDYYISLSDSNESKMTALAYGYIGYLGNEDLIDSIGQVISPDADRKYIAELINTNNDSSKDQSRTPNLTTGSDSDGALLEIRIVLPTEADAKAVEEVVSSELYDYTNDLNKEIGNHTIKLISSSEAYMFNKYAVDNRNNIMVTINNLQNNENNMKVALSDGQREAFDSIIEIKKGSSDSANNAQQETSAIGPAKPTLSKKYALLGFVMGAMIYAFVYVIIMVIRGRVNYASDAEHYTQSRVLGEIYQNANTRGIQTLFRSNLVNKYRYKGKMDSNLQVEKITDILEAICKHEGIQNATLFNMTGESGKGVLEKVLESASAKGINCNLVTIADGIDERNMLDSSYAVFALGPETEISTASKTVSLCNEYDVRSLGNLFIGEI